MKSEDKLILRAIRGSRIDRYPVWLMRQAGRYLPEYREVRSSLSGFLELCYTPELAAKVTLQPIERYGFDAAIVFSDILVIPDGLGQEVAFKENEGPILAPITKPSEIPKLDGEKFLAKLAPVYAALRLIRQELPLETALIGFAGAPWTLATYMIEGRSNRDFIKTKTWATEDSVSFAALMDVIVDAIILHLEHQIEAGAEIIQIFDSWAGVLQDREFQRWVIQPTAKIVSALKKSHPEVPIIGFPRGAGAQYLGYARDTAVDMISIDQDMPLGFVKDVLQPLTGVQGNLDPIVLAAGGPALDARVGEIISSLGKRRFVFNLGHGVIPQTPPENVERLVSLVRSSPVQR